MSARKILCLLFVATCFHLSTQKGLGKDCVEDKECVVDLDSEQRTVWCYNKQCACRAGYSKQGERCVIGGDCVTDENCTDIENSFCNNRIRSKFYCACKEGYVSDANDTLCRADLGKPCSSQSDCAQIFGNLICRDGVCSCSDNNVPKPDNKGCLPKVGHLGACTESIQCSYSNKTRCYTGICDCVPGYKYNGKVCAGEIALGNTCSYDEDCIVPGDQEQRTVWCYSRQCACRSGFVREDNRCVIGGDCVKNSDCAALENSYCNTLQKNRYKCACTESFIPAANNTKCLPIVHEIGSGCEDTAQCTEKLGEAYCNEKFQCVCSAGVALNKDKTCGRSNAAVNRAVISLSCIAAVISLMKIL